MGDFWESKSIASPQTRDADVAKPREDGTRVRRPGGGRKPEKPRAAAVAVAAAGAGAASGVAAAAARPEAERHSRMFVPYGCKAIAAKLHADETVMAQIYAEMDRCEHEHELIGVLYNMYYFHTLTTTAAILNNVSDCVSE